MIYTTWTKVREKNHKIISIYAQKAFHKIQHSFIIKTLRLSSHTLQRLPRGLCVDWLPPPLPGQGLSDCTHPRSRKWQWWHTLRSPVPGAGALTSGHRDSQMLGRCLDWKVRRDERFQLLRYNSLWVCCISAHLGSRNTDCFCFGLCYWACLYSGEHCNTERWSLYRATHRHLYYLLELLKCRHFCTWPSVLTGFTWPS